VLEAAAKAIKADKNLIEDLIEQEILKAIDGNLVFETMGGPTIATKDAEKILSLDALEKVIDENLEKVIKQPTWSSRRFVGLDVWGQTGVHLVEDITAFRDHALKGEAHEMKRGLKTAVPVMIFWAAAKKGGV